VHRKFSWKKLQERTTSNIYGYINLGEREWEVVGWIHLAQAGTSGGLL
jgi:hypothetical protein